MFVRCYFIVSVKVPNIGSKTVQIVRKECLQEGILPPAPPPLLIYCSVRDSLLNVLNDSWGRADAISTLCFHVFSWLKSDFQSHSNPLALLTSCWADLGASNGSLSIICLHLRPRALQKYDDMPVKLFLYTLVLSILI